MIIITKNKITKLTQVGAIASEDEVYILPYIIRWFEQHI